MTNRMSARINLWSWWRTRKLRRGTGAARDGIDGRDKLFSQHLAEAAGAPAILELPPVRNQGATSSCTAFAMTTAYRIACLTQLGEDPGEQSALYNYYLSRSYMGWQDSDGGSTTRAAAKALMRLGTCPVKSWPFRTKRINRAPSWRAYRDAFDERRLRGYYRLDERSNMTVRQIETALSHGIPVVFATDVDEAFMAHAHWSTIERIDQDKVVGSHAMVIYGSQGGDFLIQNSWSDAWGNHGRARVTHEFMLKEARDLWAIDVRK